MNKKQSFITGIILCIVALSMVTCSGGSDSEIFLYVSARGNDTWSGEYPDPTEDGSDGPFAKLERAREAVREIVRTQKPSTKKVTVSIRGGVYSITETFSLTGQDSGRPNMDVTWRAYQNEAVSFIGGKVVDGFESVTDQSVLKRLDPAAMGQVLRADLAAQGIDGYGEIRDNGWANGEVGMELFFNGEPMTIARYPNEGWVQVTDVPQTGEKHYHEGVSFLKKDGIPIGSHYGRFRYDGDRPKRWQLTDDIWMHGYWTVDWADEFQRIESIDTTTRTIYPEQPFSAYGFTKDQRYYYFNILEELDSPGEYYIDRKEGVLYFWPPPSAGTGTAMVSTLTDPIVQLDGTSYVTIRDITVETSRNHGIVVTNGTNNLIAGCTARNLFGTGFSITGGTSNGVLSCDVYNVERGIGIAGGDRSTLAEGHNFAENNHIHHYSRVNRTYKAAISLSGVGNRLSHNYIHDAPHMGVSFNGNEHLLEFNEIHDIAQETGDVGAFYIGRDWTQRGNIIQYNYFHHIHGPGAAGARSVYLDDWSSGMTVYGNIFYKAGMATLIGGGRDNRVDNNVFVECEPSVWIDARGTTWANYYFDRTSDSFVSTMFDGMDAMNYRNPPYSTRYPELLDYYSDNPELPQNNVISRNISYGGQFLCLFDDIDLSIVTLQKNLIADPVILRTGPLSTELENGEVFRRDNDKVRTRLEKLGNTIIDGDPGFVDAANGDFRLRDDSPVWELGFEALPVDQIGLYVDEFRSIVE